MLIFFQEWGDIIVYIPMYIYTHTGNLQQLGLPWINNEYNQYETFDVAWPY